MQNSCTIGDHVRVARRCPPAQDLTFHDDESQNLIITGRLQKVPRINTQYFSLLVVHPFDRTSACEAVEGA